MKKISFGLLCLFFVFLIEGCFNPVFYNISREVELKPSSVPGTINSIARYTCDGKEYLVTQNGSSVFYKPLEMERTGDSSVWTSRKNSSFGSLSYDFFDTEYDGEYIIKLATDSTYIYLMTVELDVRQEKGEAIIKSKKLYFTKSLTENTWTEINLSSLSENFSISLEQSTIFCTNSISAAGRKAYFRNGVDLYELNGEAVPAEIDKSTVTIPDISKKTDESLEEASKRAVLNSAVYFNGEVIFFQTLASVTNETEDSDATMYYYGNSSGIYYSTNVSAEAKKVSANGGDDVSCMAIAKDCLFFGKGNAHSSNSAGGGLFKVNLVDGVPAASVAVFTTNADAALTSSYQILTLLVAYPSKPELKNYIYASTNFKTTGNSISVSYDNIGLWAYYPGRNEWNRE